MFPENYTWSASVRLAVGTSMWGGGEMNEINTICAALKQSKAVGDNAAWFEEWTTWASASFASAIRRRQPTSGDRRSRLHAGRQLHPARRATSPAADPANAGRLRPVGGVVQAGPSGRAVDGRRGRGGPLRKRQEPARYFIKKAAAPGTRWPTVIFFDGLDVNKETQFFMGVRTAETRNGLRHRPIRRVTARASGSAALPARYDFEKPASAVVDYLRGREDVNAERIGIVGISLGGYYAARRGVRHALQGVRRLGRLYDYHVIWKAPHRCSVQDSALGAGDHLTWFLGVDTMDAALKKLEMWTLAGVGGKVECPFLLTHGRERPADSDGDARRNSRRSVPRTRR